MRMPARLSELRCAADVPATTLSTAAGLSLPIVGGLENGNAVPKLDTVERLATALGVSPTWLAYGNSGYERWKPRRPREPLPPEPPPVDLAVREISGRYTAVAMRLADARTRAGLSLRAVAEAAGMSPQAVLKVEQGRGVPLLSTIEAIAIALDIAPGWLAFGEGEGPAESA